jgi:hypothetical protein
MKSRQRTGNTPSVRHRGVITWEFMVDRKEEGPLKIRFIDKINKIRKEENKGGLAYIFALMKLKPNGHEIELIN